jgi:NAD(P)-dependent dehydrogenase (short-subunit alcohol dehydrogenase family)
MISLKGKVALVTGGGAGIGRSIAEALGQIGAKLVIGEIDPKRLETVEAALTKAGVECLAVKADVTKAKDAAGLIAAADRKFGRLDVLVNNVGDFLGIKKPFVETTEDEWQRLYDINLRHIFLVTRAAIPLMQKSGEGGSIVNISTIEAFRGIPKASIYSTFKAAITGFTKTMALELGPDGIRVNAIAPETTESEQVKVSQWVPPEYKPHIKKWIPLGRFGQPSDVAGCTVFLATDLSAWVTGTTIHLDGGVLAACGYYQLPDGGWTHNPIIVDDGYAALRHKPAG